MIPMPIDDLLMEELSFGMTVEQQWNSMELMAIEATSTLKRGAFDTQKQVIAYQFQKKDRLVNGPVIQMRVYATNLTNGFDLQQYTSSTQIKK
jgi:hypothetical protein